MDVDTVPVSQQDPAFEFNAPRWYDFQRLNESMPSPTADADAYFFSSQVKGTNINIEVIDHWICLLDWTGYPVHNLQLPSKCNAASGRTRIPGMEYAVQICTSFTCTGLWQGFALPQGTLRQGRMRTWAGCKRTWSESVRR